MYKSSIEGKFERAQDVDDELIERVQRQERLVRDLISGRAKSAAHFDNESIVEQKLQLQEMRIK